MQIAACPDDTPPAAAYLRRINHLEDSMDIVVLAVALIAALLLPRQRALIVSAVAWVAALLMVAVGPAHNADVHVASAGFWIPWAVVLVLAVLVVYGVTAVRRRRGDTAAAL
jgi:hypothetical protein